VFKVKAIFTVAKCIFSLFFLDFSIKKLYTHMKNRASNNAYKKSFPVGYL
jgi:hypothetical protein